MGGLQHGIHKLTNWDEGFKVRHRIARSPSAATAVLPSLGTVGREPDLSQSQRESIPVGAGRAAVHAGFGAAAGL